MRVALFGGSFDPPHRGHVALARLARERLALDRVLVAPVATQPLKQETAQASFTDRVAMTRLAFAGEPAAEISLLDAPHPNNTRPNYTIDTLSALRRQLDPADTLFCILGADSLLTIGKWYRSADLLTTCDFIVGARPGFDLDQAAAGLPSGISATPVPTDLPRTQVLNLAAQTGGQSRLYLLLDLAEDISATQIRAALSRRLRDPQRAESGGNRIYPHPSPVLASIEWRLQPESIGKPQRPLTRLHEKRNLIRMASNEVRAMVLAAAAVCDEKKGVDTRVLELDPLDSGFTDFFLITSGSNTRQTQAIADDIEHRMKRDFGVYANSVEGRRVAEWILLDYVDFVVHIFLEEKRAFYDIERLRKSARKVDLAELTAVLTEKTLAARKKPAAKKTTAKPAAKKSTTAVKKSAPAKQPAKKSAKRARKPMAKKKARHAQRERKLTSSQADLALMQMQIHLHHRQHHHHHATSMPANLCGLS